MSNKYFRANGYPSPFSDIKSEELRKKFNELEGAFDLLADPNISGDKGFVGGRLVGTSIVDAAAYGGVFGTSFQPATFVGTVGFPSDIDNATPGVIGWGGGGVSAGSVTFRYSGEIKAGFSSAGFFVGSGTTLLPAAVKGFLYAPDMSGLPVGVAPTVAGSVPMVVDTTNSKIMVQIGGVWKGVTVA